MSNLFSYGTVKNRPARSGFDLSNRFAFTAKAGELLPVYWKLLLPGTKVNLKDSHFTRTMPVNTAAFTRIKEYFDWYFVPLRLINKNLPQAIVQMNDQPVQATSILANKIVTGDIPYTTQASLTSLLNNYQSGAETLDSAGFYRNATAAKLLRYLRYGNFCNASSYASVGTNKNFGLSSNSSFSLFGAKNISMNVLPLAAYQKIYCDYFRFEQWEKACPYTYNFDYYTGGDVLSSVDSSDFWTADNILSLRYANYPKDLFMGMMPSSQFGSVATVSGNISSLYSNGRYAPLVNASQGGDSYIRVSATSANPLVLKQSEGKVIVDNTLGIGVYSLKSSFDILSFRIAEATQKWKEVTRCAKQGYKEQLEAHFNVKLSEALSDHCRYIGGNSSDLSISEVLNTNLGTESAEIKGKGVGSGYGDESFECNEHGILMCIYHATPVLDYQLSGHDLQLLHTLATDLPVPEFDHIGMESLPTVSMFDYYGTDGGSQIANSIPSLGYVPRYIAYKTSVDWYSGAFETTLNQWLAPLTHEIQTSKLAFGSSSTYTVSWAWFKIDPAVLNSIFVTAVDSTWDTDQFLVNAFFDVKVVQNLDYNGMPY
nr:MAG TPA: Major capsid protein [Microviridae sp.]